MYRKIIFIRLVTTILAMSINLGYVVGVGAYPEPQVITQPDGSRLTIQLHGDEWYNWVATTDGYRIISNQQNIFEYAIVLKSGAIVPSGVKVSEIENRRAVEQNFLKTISKGPGINGETIRKIRDERRNGMLKSGTVSTFFPTKGKRKLLVILANFSDTNPSYTRADFNRYMNESGYNGTGSFKDFYLENSRGQLEITSVVTEWVTLPKPHDYYGPRAAWGEFAYTSIKTASEQGVDFSNFDNDGDGIVEGIAIIHQGPGQEVTGNEKDIWSHSWTLSAAGYNQAARTFNGVIVNHYTTQPETRNASGAMNTIGVMCHEFGHNLGAPDFYDTNSDIDGKYDGTGRWDLMASGSYNGAPSGSSPAHHTAFTKILYKWTTSTEITQPGTISLDPVISTGKIYRINSPVLNEYLLLENRQRTGFDMGLPGKGLIVYHVDGVWINSRTGSNEINIGAHQGLYPIAAGGIINSPSCPFPGSQNINQLTDLSTPAMKTWSGEGFNRSLTAITEVDGVIYFDFMALQNGSPIALKVNEINHSSMQIQWAPGSQGFPVLLAWSTNGIFGTPQNGKTYTSNEIIDGGGHVLYYGADVLEFLHSGLAPATQYFYSVWSYKDGVWTSPLKASGTTTPLPVDLFPWFEGFEQGLANWKQISIAGENKWKVSTQGTNKVPAKAFENVNFASFYSGTFNKPVTRLISPVLNLMESKNYVVEFHHVQAQWNSDQDSLRVLIKKESSLVWEEIAKYALDEQEWIKRRISLPYSEPVKIAFEGYANWGYGIGIDNIFVKEYNDCFSHKNSVLSVENSGVDLSVMTLNWTLGHGDGVLIIGRKNGKVLDLPVNGTNYNFSSVFGNGDLIGNNSYVVYSGTGSSVTLSGLDHSSDYYFAFFGLKNGQCYQLEPQFFSFSTKKILHTISVEVLNGGLPVVNARVNLDGNVKETDENGLVQWQVTHREEFVSLVSTYQGMETNWKKVSLHQNQNIKIVLKTLEPIVPNNISHIKDNKKITLSWNPVIDEGFENYAPFALTIPGWIFYDLDKKPTWYIEGYDFPNKGYTGSFIVLDTHSKYLMQKDKGSMAYSGPQVIGCFAANGGANNDWIISPTFKVQQGDNISFMARSFTNQYGLERINVLISIQEPTPQAYTNISGGVKEVPVEWTAYTYGLQNYVGKKVKFAIQCVSNDALLLLIDNIKVGKNLSSAPNYQVPGKNNESIITKIEAPFNQDYSKPTDSQNESSVEMASNIGSIAYTILLNGNVVSTNIGFGQTSIVTTVPECNGNIFSVKTNYIMESVSSDWVNYTAAACYSVIFKVKNPQLLPVEGAIISFNGTSETTNSEGIASFHGLSPGDNLPFSIIRENYDGYSGTLSINGLDRDLIIFLTPTSVKENILNGSEIVMFPNPARNEVVIQGVLPGEVELQLFDMAGRLVISSRFYGGTDLKLNINDVKHGIYFVVLKQKGDMWRKKLVKTY